MEKLKPRGIGGAMDHPSGDVPIAEPSPEPVELVVQGEVVGGVDGLVWSDASGLEILSITIGGSQIAVPFVSGQWRDHSQLDLSIDPVVLESAPRLIELREVGGSRAIEIVGDHYSINLAGPPPGPNPGPLPPWWNRINTAEADRGLEELH
jgi:hypothetical protein